uniref:ALMS motif domain-containing protein n=1 Tax=Neogobius melanostomus TaxID=47308 RepID=A0A8C6S4A1_9GOBI
MSEVHHCRSLQNNTAANSSEASVRDIAASVHRNVLSWAVWQGHKEKKSVSFAALTPAASSQAVRSISCSTAPSLLRTRNVPDVVGPDPGTSAPTQNVSTALDVVRASSMRFLTPQPFGKGGFSKARNTMRMTNSQSNFYGQTTSMVKPNALRQTYSPSDRLAVKGPGKRKEQVVQSEWDGNLEGSPNQASSRTFFCSRVHFDIPPSSIISAVILVKSLCISLEDLKTNPTLYLSTLSCHLSVSSVKKYKKTNHRRASRCRESGGGLTHSKGLQSKWQSHKVRQTPPAHSASTVDSDLQAHSATTRLLSFRGPSPPYIKATERKGNADEKKQAAQGNFEHRPYTVDARSWDKQSSEKKERLEDNCRTEPNKSPSLNMYKTCYYHSRLKGDAVDGAAKCLSLKEALELLRPDFISRSQSRLRRLEQRVMRRRADCDLDPGHRDAPGTHRRNCTTPDPLSDNLFKPRERAISGREMQLRSRRIYYKLPEVTKGRRRRKDELYRKLTD